MTTKNTRIARIRETAQRYIDADAFSGIEWLIQHQGSVLDAGSAGYARKVQQTPIPGNAIYRIDLATETIHHVAGTGEQGYTGDGGPAPTATRAGP